MTPSEKLIKRKDAMRLLQVSDGYLRARVKEGVFSQQRVSYFTCFDVEELEAHKETAQWKRQQSKRKWVPPEPEPEPPPPIIPEWTVAVDVHMRIPTPGRDNLFTNVLRRELRKKQTKSSVEAVELVKHELRKDDRYVGATLVGVK